MPAVEMSGALGKVRSCEFRDYEIVYCCVMRGSCKVCLFVCLRSRYARFLFFREIIF